MMDDLPEEFGSDEELDRMAGIIMGNEESIREDEKLKTFAKIREAVEGAGLACKPEPDECSPSGCGDCDYGVAYDLGAQVQLNTILKALEEWAWCQAIEKLKKGAK
ncbi:hypothetical protein LCGC14_0369940 [marine sediment metagenome]|uniref:Uncharacterized protein n=1 Tax=marine sediment metagenome TaxID=412755 RepID=A0A0F9T5I0_9ZZZZ